MAVGAMWRLVLPVLRSFGELALRVFAALVLPLVLDGRAISSPRVNKAILSGQTFILEGAERARIVLCRLPRLMSAMGQKQTSAHVRVMSALPPKRTSGLSGDTSALGQACDPQSKSSLNSARRATRSASRSSRPAERSHSNRFPSGRLRLLGCDGFEMNRA